MKLNIGLLKGDGIGPEIVDSAVRVLEKIASKFGHEFQFTPYLIGGAAIDATGAPLPEETVKGCLASDSVLLGAVGGPKWDNLPGNVRPEKALLGIRAAMGLYTNLRPARLYAALKDDSPLRPDLVEKGFDITTYGNYSHTGGTLIGNADISVGGSLTLINTSVVATGKRVGSLGLGGNVTTVTVSGSSITADRIGALGVYNETFTFVVESNGATFSGTFKCITPRVSILPVGNGVCISSTYDEFESADPYTLNFAVHFPYPYIRTDAPSDVKSL